MSTSKGILTLFFWGMLAGQAFAGLGDGNLGFYNYEPPKPKKDPDATADVKTPAAAAAPTQAPPKYSDKQLWEMHPDRFAPYMDEVKKWAVKTLAPADVAEYQRVQDLMRRKTRAFVGVTGYVQAMGANRANAWDMDMPITTPGRNAAVQQEREEVQRTLDQAAGKYALVFVKSRGCLHCRTQEGIVRQFREKHPGWKVEPLYVEERPDVATMMKITATPTLVLIKGGDSKEETLAIGVVSLDAMEQRLFRLVRLKEGKVKPQEFYLRESERGGPFDPSIYDGEK